jgi:hypothetical protein
MTIKALVEAINSAMSDDEDSKQKFLQTLGNVLGAMANVIQIAGWVIPAASNAASLIRSLAGKMAEADPAMDRIQSEISNIIHVQHAMVTHFDIEDITKILNAAQQRLDTLTKFGMHSPEVSIPETIQDTGTAVRNLRSRNFWTRPFFADLVEVDDWIPTTPPEHDGEVFEPALTMAAYPTAIGIWMNAMAQLEPTKPPEDWPLDIKNAVRDLISYYEEMFSGLRAARVPTLDEMFDTPPIPPGSASPWVLASMEYGAVDVYTQRRVVGRYPGDEFPLSYRIQPGVPFGFGGGTTREDMAEMYPVFNVRYTLGSIARLKALYNAEGLHSMWESVQALAPLAGVRATHFDPRSSWSIRDLHELLEPVIPPQEPPPLVRVTVRDVVAGLHAVTSAASKPDPPSVTDGHTPEARTSLRMMLDVATP